TPCVRIDSLIEPDRGHARAPHQSAGQAVDCRPAGLTGAPETLLPLPRGACPGEWVSAPVPLAPPVRFERLRNPLTRVWSYSTSASPGFTSQCLARTERKRGCEKQDTNRKPAFPHDLVFVR